MSAETRRIIGILWDALFTIAALVMFRSTVTITHRATYATKRWSA